MNKFYTNSSSMQDQPSEKVLTTDWNLTSSSW